MSCDIDYLDASYKGVAFRIKESKDTFGRRGESYDYPNSETPGYLDLGRKTRKYTVTGYAYGDDHLSQSSAMIAASESRAPGVLVHPLFGAVLVACVSLQVGVGYIEKKRISTYEFEFIEPGLDIGSAVPLGSFVDGLLNSFSRITDILSNSVDAAFSVPSGLLPLAVSEAQRTAFSISSGLAGIDDSRFYSAFGALERVSSLEVVARSERFGKLFQSSLSDISEAGPKVLGPRATYDRLIQISDQFRSPVPAIFGLERPLNALYGSTRIGAVANAVLVTRRIEYKTLFDAMRDLDKMIKILDGEAQVAVRLGEDVLYSEILGLRARTIEDMIRTNIGKPGVIFRKRSGQLPSLVLAYEVYADASRAQELEQYNPGFSPWALGEQYWSAAR